MSASLPKEAIVELQKILISDYGQKIDQEKVEKIGNRLISMFDSILFDQQPEQGNHATKKP
jgi:hypothetical protein